MVRLNATPVVVTTRHASEYAPVVAEPSASDAHGVARSCSMREPSTAAAPGLRPPSVLRFEIAPAEAARPRTPTVRITMATMAASRETAVLFIGPGAPLAKG